ncbi:hypothetical protein [Flavobacterium chilense]|uniref:Uncharacterized protein n=1 Tax=Flavobacterium chilense TaxID=946677 RepID=A0A1M7IR03_9FLAO|nr:hypothetical protein [Flavobacterium chilense]SHM43244.1 hypothetical protein SAMN05444484_10617 [Flavobacterium chilense]
MKQLREFFWPLLEKANPKTLKEYSVDNINVSEENIDKVLDLCQKTYDSELSRGSSVETKSSLFIGTLSVVTSVVLAVTTTLVNKNNFSLALLSIVILLFVLIVYMVRTIWFSIKVLERRSFHTIHHNDYLFSEGKLEFSKKLIVQLINKTNRNTTTINSKVNNMTMAQEYFKRAIVVLLLYSVLLLLFFVKSFLPDLNLILSKIIVVINSIYLSSGLICLFSILFLISLVFNLILCKKLKKRKLLRKTKILKTS